MKKALIILVLFLSATLANKVSAQELLLCELGIEFKTGSAYLSRAMQDNFIENCAPKLRNIGDDNVHIRGYTNHEEWVGGNNFGMDTDSTNIWANEALERPLSEQRAYNTYSLMVNDPSIALDTEKVSYAGTAGENKKTVRVFRIPRGVSLGEVTKILDAIEGVRSEVALLREGIGRIEDNSSEAMRLSIEARDASNRAAEASERAAKASEETRDEFHNRFGDLFIRTGGRAHSDIGYGATLAIGSGVGRRLETYIEGYAEWTSHEAFLLERPDPTNETLHWGSWYSGHFVLRYYLGKNPRQGATAFLETGPGIVHVEYTGPAESIGWHHTGFSAVLRGGLQVRSGPVGAELYVGENFSHFPKNRVDEDLATGKFTVGFHGGARITLYL